MNWSGTNKINVKTHAGIAEPGVLLLSLKALWIQMLQIKTAAPLTGDYPDILAEVQSEFRQN